MVYSCRCRIIVSVFISVCHRLVVNLRVRRWLFPPCPSMLFIVAFWLICLLCVLCVCVIVRTVCLGRRLFLNDVVLFVSSLSPSPPPIVVVELQLSLSLSLAHPLPTLYRRRHLTFLCRIVILFFLFLFNYWYDWFILWDELNWKQINANTWRFIFMCLFSLSGRWVLFYLMMSSPYPSLRSSPSPSPYRSTICLSLIHTEQIILLHLRVAGRTPSFNISPHIDLISLTCLNLFYLLID